LGRYIRLQAVCDGQSGRAFAPVDLTVSGIEIILMDNQNKLSEEVRQPRAAETKLRHSNSEMEQRIESRTAELAKANELLQAEVADHMRAEKKLKETMDQLKRFNDLAVGRELRMVELKAEVNELCCQLDLQRRYFKPGRNESFPEPATDSQSCTESAVESEI
jgi:DNA repair ATPase RecN